MAFRKVFSVAGLFASSIVVVSGNVIDERSHPRDLHKRSEVDCGTWVMKCLGIENSCNNACFFRDQLSQTDDYVATFRTDVQIDHNQFHSGCSIGDVATTPCTVMPFSQKMQEGPFDLTDPACEQFPRADWKQDDFNNDSGLPRNALRCIERSESNAGNDQWNAFRDGTGDQPKRTCTGPMNQPDTDYKFRIEMDTGGANQDLLGYCLTKEPQNIMPGEFWMTHLKLPNGQVDFPYNSAENNQYTTGTRAMSLNADTKGWLQASIEQCVLKLDREDNPENPYEKLRYQADFSNTDGLAIGGAVHNMEGPGDVMILTGGDDLHTTLSITSSGDIGDVGTKGSRIDFRSAIVHQEDFNNLLTDFNFTTESQGRDVRYKQVDGSSKGYYCDVGDVTEHFGGVAQSMHCYFPCVALS